MSVQRLRASLITVNQNVSFLAFDGRVETVASLSSQFKRVADFIRDSVRVVPQTLKAFVRYSAHRPHQDAAWQENGRLGMPVVTKVAYLRTAEQFLPTSRRDLDLANLHAATGEVGGGGQHLHSAYSKSADGDEHSVIKRDQRYQRHDRNGNLASDRERRKKPAGFGQVEERTDSR